MNLSDLPQAPPPPEQVVTTWAGSRGQDFLGLRSPAERIANQLMDGVTTQSPLIRYIGYRAWIIARYTSLGGLDRREDFYAFAGKCEAALAIGHQLAADPTKSLIGARDALKNSERDGLHTVKRLTKILAVDVYAGPSQDLSIAFRRAPVPALSAERGLPLAAEISKNLDKLRAVSNIDLESIEQDLNEQDALDLAAAFPMQAPSGAEREMLIEALCPKVPRSGEFARLSAYCFLLHLASAGKIDSLDEDAVFHAATEGDELAGPEELHSVADGWLRFLVRDSLVAVHERAVSVALGVLAESPHATTRAELLLGRIAAFDPSGVLENVGLPGHSASTPIGQLCAAISEQCKPDWTRSGLQRWSGAIDEVTVCRALRDHPEPEAVALLPVAWILAVIRAGNGLGDSSHSVDALSGTSIARMGLGDVVVPMVRSWQGSSEPLGHVIAKLVRRSVEQHLSIAWYRMQADPRRNVALIVSDGTTWTADGNLNPGRATSRQNQAINWLGQLGLIDEEGITPDGQHVLDRGLRTLAGTGAQP